MPNTVESNKISCKGYLSGKRIILGVTGSVAAYKAAYLASALAQRGADVHVVMTQHATQMIGPATFWSLTKNPVILGLFDPPTQTEITHVSLPESADLLLIAPASANIIGKLANGIADDMLSTMSLVVRCPVIIAPAMNVNMYTNPVVVANMDRLRELGCNFVESATGMLACGEEGVGRLADPDDILRVVDDVLAGGSPDLIGVKVVVTAGPTQEPIDPVRFISNRSSGKMGYAIAERAAQRGADVVLISGPTNLKAPEGVKTINVNTVYEMHEAVGQSIDRAKVFISAAAPADFTPENFNPQKIKKTDHLTLNLSKSVDILAEVGRNKKDTILVGFAAETQDLIENAKAKLKSKNLDMIIANDVSAGSDVFGSDTNQVTLISKTGDSLCWPRMSKRDVANSILDYIKMNFLEELG